jgi:hypothetical protein
MRNAVDSLSDDVLADIFRYLLPGPCAATSVSVAPRIASSPTPITVRSFHRLSSASSMAAGGRAIATSHLH